ncbi:MAG: bifunctional (p)ppGpp synthetase/guanosine-3',5'-bis(diphosphate) 3'-pyrophosphohydrolase [Chloroflexi bacterium]|nr:bifunctional (p)ppGpp synthetase/guanosine-3',5'-bis(diphosphate) 3'-pyrophosphohydrolase [Chloroflexota bacterium]
MTQNEAITLPQLLDMLPLGAESDDALRLKHAYTFALQAHGDRVRETGETYIEHDLSVAGNMVELGVGSNTIIAGFLHDILAPHTGVGETAVFEKFGSEIGGLVSGLAKLYAYANQEQYQQTHLVDRDAQLSEEVRRAILSIIEGDIRVILIRMVDCLQGLRGADKLPPHRQRKVASEAMNIYAPLANRLGVWQLKWELEDSAFRFLEPNRYKEIATHLADRRIERDVQVKQAVNRLQQKIKAADINASVIGRPKHIYSIYRKMVRKGLDFEQIYDIQALRVILKSSNFAPETLKNNKEIEEAERSLCYQVLGLVHSFWQPVPREFDDYIAAPKPNGYKSLHTAVIDPENGQTLEVQIRTQRMHEEAEKGVAAHWTYKEEGKRVSASVQRRIQNLRELLSNIRETDEDDVDNDLIETEIFAERIYVFTPKGDVIDLSAGSTPIDFAYAIHTQVGHRCRGARVNGKMVSLDYELKSGERVDVLTKKVPKPSRDWMNPTLGYTGSARTRSKIRQWFRTQEQDQNIIQGREVVERELKRLGLLDTYNVEAIAEALKYDDVDQFLAKVGFGDIHSAQITGAISRLQDKLKPDDELRPLLLKKQPTKSKGLTVKGVAGLHTRMAKCCTPIPPEPIIGYITRGKGITIHQQTCNQVKAINERERLIDVSWGEDADKYPIPIIITAFRQPKIVDDILNILRGQNIPIPKTKTTSSGDGFTSLHLIVEVESLDQLNWLLNKLDNLPNVTEAKRQRWS